MKATVVMLLIFSLAACEQKGPKYTGRFKINASTEYVALEYSSSIAGACEGWNALEIRKLGASSGMENILCWKREGKNITVTDRTGGHLEKPTFLTPIAS